MTYLSHPEVGSIQNCPAKFHRKIPEPRHATFLKERLHLRCLSVNCVKFQKENFKRALPADCFSYLGQFARKTWTPDFLKRFKGQEIVTKFLFIFFGCSMLWDLCSSHYHIKKKYLISFKKYLKELKVN